MCHKQSKHTKDHFSSSMKQRRQDTGTSRSLAQGWTVTDSADPGTHTHAHTQEHTTRARTHAACTSDSLSFGTGETSSLNPHLPPLGVHTQEAFRGGQRRSRTQGLSP